MKQYIGAIILLLSALVPSYAQRMLPKQKGMEVNYGLLLNGQIKSDYYLGLGMVRYFNSGNYWNSGIEYERKKRPYKDIPVPTETFLAETGYSFRLIGDRRKTVQLNGALVGIGGYESINRGQKLLDDGALIISKSGFVYGGSARLSLETFLSDHFVVVLQGKGKLLWGTSLERFRPSVGLGLRFNF